MRSFLTLLVLVLFTVTLQAQNAWINEIHYDNAGGDQDELIEVVIENASSYTLADFSVYLYNGNNGSVYDSVSLSSFTQGSTSGNFTIYYNIFPSNGIQNGSPDAIAFGYQGSVISGQFLSYEGTLTGVDGPGAGQTSVDIGVAEDNTTPIGQSLQLSGTGTAYANFTWQVPATATAGSLNNNQSIGTFTPDPEPTNYATAFGATASGLSVTLDWTDATGAQLPAAYLILASDNPNITAPTDGTPVADDNDFSDGNGAANVFFGVETYTFSNLDASTPYYFQIFSYTNSGQFIDYKNSPAAPLATATTPFVLTAVNFNDYTFGTWDTISVASDKDWFIDDFGTDVFAKASGYQGNAPSDDWLISPPIQLNNYTNEVLTFISASNYTGPDLEVLISTDYTGSGNPTSATWTALPATLSTGSWVWTPSGSIDLSGYAGTGYVAFRYTSTATDAATWEVDDVVITASPAGTPTLSLNEFLADNETAYMDPSDNEYDEWIEIYNPGNSGVSLLNWSLSNDHASGHRWYFGDTTLASGDYLIVWADEDTMDAGLHTNFEISDSGDEIYLYNPSGQVVDSIIYPAQFEDTSYARIPNGFGTWQFAKPTPMGPNMLFPIPDTTAPEVLSAAAVDANTVVVVFSEAVSATAENTANYTGLGSISSATRSAELDTVTLALGSALTSGQVYTLTISGIEDTSGNVMSVAFTGYIYWGTITAELVITEIMYNPPEVGVDSLEYMEIYNNGAGPVPMEGFYFSEGVDLVFPSIIILPGEYLVIANDADAVSNALGIAGVLEWTSGALTNSSEDIVLKAPDGSTLDSLEYSDSAPWPEQPDGNGPSLVLCDPSANNANPANWTYSVEYITMNAAGDSIYGTPGGPCAGSGLLPGGDMINWSIYPVPASSQLNLTLPQGQWEIAIFDIRGRMIMNVPGKTDGSTMDISSLLPGAYIIRAQDQKASRSSTKPLIIK